MKTRSVIFILVLSLGFASTSFASHSITYSGRILTPSGVPVSGQFVGFRIRILAGNSDSCPMYEEIKTLDMRNTNGSFVINIGDGSVAGVYNVASISNFDEIFKNDRTFNFLSSGSCPSNPYTAGTKDGRKLYVEFREAPGNPWEVMPIMGLNHVPFAYNSLYASYADRVGTHTNASLLRVENAGTPSSVAALTPTNFSDLLAILNGTTSLPVANITATGNISSNSVSTRSAALSPQSVTPGGTGTMQFLELAANGTNSVGFKAPDNITSSLTWTLPATDGTPNQVLTTDGAGILSWSTPAGGGGNFVADGTVPMTGNIRLNGNYLSGDGGNEGVFVATDGKVGIGTASPASGLDVSGGLSVGTHAGVNPAPSGGMIISGDLGIGTNFNSGGTPQIPNADLHISNGTGAATSFRMGGAASWSTNFNSSASGVLSISGGNAAFGINNTVRNAGFLIDMTGSGNFRVQNSGSTFLFGQQSSGNVGIGSGETSPTAKLMLGAGTATAGTAPLKLTAGTNLTTPEAGAIEFDGTSLFYTDSTNARRTIANQDATGTMTSQTGLFTGSVKIKDGTVGGEVTIAAPTGFTSYNLTLPTTDGNANQALTTDGSGVLSWTNIGNFRADGTVPMTGTLLTKPQTLNSTSTINFATGNIQFTNASCGAFNLHNMVDGGSYTLIIKGTTSATCSFTAFSDAGTTGLTERLPPDHGATVATTQTIYNFIVGGTDVYVSWVTGY